MGPGLLRGRWRRFSRKRQPTRSAQEDADEKAEVKRLTVRMKKAPSAKELVKVLDAAMDGLYFDFIHASAAYTQLVTLKRRQCLEQTDWESPALLRLHARVEDMALQGQLNAQASANVLWSIVQLFDRFSIPTKLLIALLKSVPTKVKGMDAQELSNSFGHVQSLRMLRMMFGGSTGHCGPDPQESKAHDTATFVQLSWGSSRMKCPRWWRLFQP